MPKISVIIPVYNNEPYVAKAIESVLAQSYTDYEIIVLNDGSTDNSEREILKYHSQLIYIKQRNKGRGAARNAALKVARGEYIAFLDSDDFWTKDKLAVQADYLDKHPDVGIVYTDVSCIDAQDNLVFFNRLGNQLAYSGFIFPQMLKSIFVMTSGVMMRASCFEKVGYFDPKILRGQDYDLWLRLAIFYKFAFINGEYVLYRGIRNWKKPEVRIASFKGRIRAYQKLLKQYPDRTKKLGRDFYLNMIRIYQELGLAHIQLDEYQQASVYCQKALKLLPESQKLQRISAISCCLAGKLTKAQSLIRKILRTDPFLDKMHFYLGCCYFKKGDWQRACSSFQTAIRCKRNESYFPAALNNLALTYIATGEITEALFWFRNALNQKSDYQEAAINCQLAQQKERDLNRYQFTQKTFGDII